MKTTLAKDTQKNVEEAIKNTRNFTDKILTKNATISIYLNLLDNNEIDILDFVEIIRRITKL